jgi:DNA-binding transcriptional regulator YiaG
MKTATMTSWVPGTDLPYAIPLGENRILGITLRANWLKADRSGQPLLLPRAVRAIDRLRAIFASQQMLTAGFITTMREAMGLTQNEFGRKLGVSKMTVSRWECGKMKPGPATARAIRQLQVKIRYEGVNIDGERRIAGRRQR